MLLCHFSISVFQFAPNSFNGFAQICKNVMKNKNWRVLNEQQAMHLIKCITRTLGIDQDICKYTCARSLGVIDQETFTGLKFPNKNLEPSEAEKFRVQEQLRFETDRRVILRSRDGANSMQEKKSGTIEKENEDDKGYGVVLSSGEKVLHKTSDLEDRKRHARSIMESPSDNAEETVNSKENDMGEDIVVMDYAQPHRKPPIHNWEP